MGNMRKVKRGYSPISPSFCHLTLTCKSWFSVISLTNQSSKYLLSGSVRSLIYLTWPPTGKMLFQPVTAALCQFSLIVKWMKNLSLWGNRLTIGTNYRMNSSQIRANIFRCSSRLGIQFESPVCSGGFEEVLSECGIQSWEEVLIGSWKSVE